MATDFSELTTEVERNEAVDDSAIALINGIAGRIEAAVEAANAGNTQALTDLAASLRNSSQELADAVTANTPVETEE